MSQRHLTKRLPLNTNKTTDSMITKINFNDHTFTSYSIRKFTPRECFRLMGVRENIIDRMMSTYEQAKNIVPAIGKPDEQVVSNAQLYKQAGNSIVVDVIVKIYENLFERYGDVIK